jgi:tRNA 2-(methylsulfanyl)-N6-isopentenyladenosine37 hydroxylase
VPTSTDLPLVSSTPPAWAKGVLQNANALLSDQVYLEKKAANNALEFLNLWPGPQAPAHWLASVASIARDETLHMQAVLKLLEKRGGELERAHKNPYAYDLRKLIRKGQGKDDLTDRLIVSALVEARSCERFIRLSEESKDAELVKFYGNLVASENGHYQLFLDMAKKVSPASEVNARWVKLLEKEAEIMESQPVDFKIHSGWKMN